MTAKPNVDDNREPSVRRSPAEEVAAAGLPLEAAFAKFAPARRLPDDRGALASVIAPMHAGEDVPEEVRLGLNVIRETIYKHDEVMQNRWARFRAQLVAGRLKAVGRPAGLDSEVAIPASLWAEGEIDLSLSRLTSDEGIYEDVRVARATA